MFLRRLLASLARAYKLHVYDFFFYVGTFGGLAPPPPPPHTKKLATLLLPAFAHQKNGQMKMAASVPPHSLHEIAATGHQGIILPYLGKRKQVKYHLNLRYQCFHILSSVLFFQAKFYA